MFDQLRDIIVAIEAQQIHVADHITHLVKNILVQVDLDLLHDLAILLHKEVQAALVLLQAEVIVHQVEAVVAPLLTLTLAHTEVVDVNKRIF